MGHENPRRAHQRCGGPNPRPFVCLATGRIVPERRLLGVVRREGKIGRALRRCTFWNRPRGGHLAQPLGRLGRRRLGIHVGVQFLAGCFPFQPGLLQRICGDVRCGELHGLLHPPDFLPKHGLDGHRLGAEQHQGVQGLSRAHLAVHPVRHGRVPGALWPVGLGELPRVRTQPEFSFCAQQPV